MACNPYYLQTTPMYNLSLISDPETRQRAALLNAERTHSSSYGTAYYDSPAAGSSGTYMSHYYFGDSTGSTRSVSYFR